MRNFIMYFYFIFNFPKQWLQYTIDWLCRVGLSKKKLFYKILWIISFIFYRKEYIFQVAVFVPHTTMGFLCLVVNSPIILFQTNCGSSTLRQAHGILSAKILLSLAILDILWSVGIQKSTLLEVLLSVAKLNFLSFSDV